MKESVEKANLFSQSKMHECINMCNTKALADYDLFPGLIIIDNIVTSD